MSPTPYATVLLLSSAVALILGLSTVFREEGTRESVSFFLLTVAVAVWLMAFGEMAWSDDSREALRWARTAYLAIPLIPVLTYDFTVRVLGVRAERTLPVLAGWVGGILLAATATGTDWILTGVRAYGWGYYTRLGWGGAVLLLFYGIYFGLSVWEYRRAIPRSESEAERKRAVFLVLAFGIGYLGAIDFLPSFGMEMFPFGFLLVVTCLLLVGWTVRRYHLVDLTPSFAAEQIVATMADPLVAVDAGGTIRIANPAACAVFDRPAADLVGRRLEVLAGDDPGARAELEALLVREAVRDREIVLPDRRGEPVDLSVSTSRIPDRSGEVAGTVIIAHDIREQKRAAEALEESQQRYHSLFLYNPDAVYGFDREGRFVAANPACEELLGRDAADLVGQSFAPVIAPEDRERAAQIFADVLSGEPREYEVAIDRSDGERIEIQGVSVPIVVDGEVVGVFGIARDVTEAKAAEEALRRERSYFAGLFEGSPDAIVVLDDEDRIRRANASFVEMFGYAAEEAVGRTTLELLVPDDRHAEARELTERVGHGRSVYAETVRLRRDGTPVDVSIVGRTVKIDGLPPQIYGIYRDIGERKEAERALREKEEQLRRAQRLEAVGRLAGGIAHDFNNLLTVIQGHAELVLGQLQGDGQVRRDVVEIERAAERAASLTQQLLAFSRRQVLQITELDLNRVVRDTERMLHRVIGEPIALATELEEDLPRVKADAAQIDQALMNLVINARDAMPGGGQLTVATGTVVVSGDESDDPSSDVTPGPYVVLEVRDTGHGMDEETLGQIFDPFFTTKEHGKGTGLGLATVFGIVKQSGGFIRARSTVGEGTSFRIYLPPAGDAKTDAEDAAGVSPKDERARDARATVLVVEDEEGVRSLARRILRRDGYRVLVAENAEEALRVVEDVPDLDLMLTDVVMPGMDGRALAREVLRARPHTRVLLMSGYDPEEAGSGPANGSGADALDLLEKPFTPDVLTRAVRGVLDGEGIGR